MSMSPRKSFYIAALQPMSSYNGGGGGVLGLVRQIDDVPVYSQCNWRRCVTRCTVCTLVQVKEISNYIIHNIFTKPLENSPYHSC